MNKKILIIVIIILISAGFAFFSMRSVLTPYVSFKTAMDSGEFVQVIGKLNRLKPVNHEGEYFSFILDDGSNSSMNIRYKGVIPVNFEHAEQIVVLGYYDGRKSVFEADKILVKCPSKYRKTD